MTRHPWVAKADRGIRFGVQVAAVRDRPSPLEVTLHDDPLSVLIEAGKVVERLGYDSLYLHDHPSFSPDPWTGLAALAMATDRVMLGSMVFCVPYRHPTMLARLSTDLDNLSRGRFIFGVGVGWAEPEFAAFGLLFNRAPVRQAALAEAVEIVDRLWQGEPVSYRGQHYAIENVRINPRPIQRPRPPVLIAGPGKKTTLRQVALYADACNIDEMEVPVEQRLADPGAGPRYLRERLEVLERHCEAVGRPYDEILRTHFVTWLIVAPTEAEVHAKVRRSVPDKHAPINVAIVAGTPEQIVDYYQARVDAGMQYFVYQLLDGMDHETLHLVANEVMPHVR